MPRNNTFAFFISVGEHIQYVSLRPDLEFTSINSCYLLLTAIFFAFSGTSTSQDQQVKDLQWTHPGVIPCQTSFLASDSFVTHCSFRWKASQLVVMHPSDFNHSQHGGDIHLYWDSITSWVDAVVGVYRLTWTTALLFKTHCSSRWRFVL